MKKIYLYICILSLFCACSSNELSLSDQLGYKASIDTVDILQQEYPLIFSCMFGMQGDKQGKIKINKLGIQFPEEVSQERARSLLLHFIETYLDVINSTEELKPHLSNYPFTKENIEFVVYFSAPDGSMSYHPNINVCAFRNGKLIYKTEEEGQTKGYKSIIRESYEEAMEKEKNSLMKN